MNRNLATVLIIWLLLSVAGILWFSSAAIFPAAAAREAALIDDAFRLLLILSVPVAALVLTLLGYSLWRFRVPEDDGRDGPPLSGNQPVAVGWFVVTTALAVFVVFNPGLKGLNELAEMESADPLVIQVEGEQWHWNVTYPQHDLSYERALQIALPVDQTVMFEITSKDVIHSFWVPAFRMKMDALPGQTTTLYVTPDEEGSFETEPLLRAQCAELCGTGHPRMQMGVRVLGADAFAEWIAATQEVTGGTEMDMGMDMGGEMEMDDDGAGMEMDEGAEMEMEMDDGDGTGMEMDEGAEMEMDQ